MCSGVNSNRLVREGRGGLNSPAGAVLTQNGEASGLAPEVRHGLPTVFDRVREVDGFDRVDALALPSQL